MKNAFCLLLLSSGIPMILMGDEIGRTQRGNNNPYCHDNEFDALHTRCRPAEKPHGSGQFLAGVAAAPAPRLAFSDIFANQKAHEFAGQARHGAGIPAVPPTTMPIVDPLVSPPASPTMIDQSATRSTGSHVTGASLAHSSGQTSGAAYHWRFPANGEQSALSTSGKLKFLPPGQGGPPTGIFMHLHGDDPVNPATGEFIVENEDLRLSGIDVPFRLKRTYRSLWDYAGPIGYGWTHSYDQKLMVSPLDCHSRRTADWYSGDGAIIQFRLDSGTGR